MLWSVTVVKLYSHHRNWISMDNATRSCRESSSISVMLPKDIYRLGQASSFSTWAWLSEIKWIVLRREKRWRLIRWQSSWGQQRPSTGTPVKRLLGSHRLSSKRRFIIFTRSELSGHDVRSSSKLRWRMRRSRMRVMPVVPGKPIQG